MDIALCGILFGMFLVLAVLSDISNTIKHLNNTNEEHLKNIAYQLEKVKDELHDSTHI